MTGPKDLADTVAKLISDFGTYYRNQAIIPISTHMEESGDNDCLMLL